MRISTEIFNKYDLRGKFPSEINERTSYLVARSFSRVLGEDLKIAVGRDGKMPSELVYNGFRKGIREAGHEVIDLGLCSSPLVYWAVAELELDGGAVITASHTSDQSHTGIKMVREGGVPLEDGLKEIRSIIEDDDLSFVRKEGKETKRDLMDEYIDSLKELAGEVEDRKIVMDAGGGMAGPVLEKLFDNAIPLFWEISTGESPHDTDVTFAESREDLVRKVKEEKADMGFIWDEDADRFFVVDSRGEVVDPSFVSLIIADYLTEKEDRVVVDIRASRAIEKELEAEVVWSKSWHPEIKKKMREEGAVFGSETSGHYIFRDLHFIDDGILAALYFLKATEGLDLESYIDSLKDKYKILPEERFSIEGKDIDGIFKKIEKNYKNITKEDGVTVWGDDWKMNLRRSQTEPILKLNVDAKDQETLEKRTNEIREIIQD